MKPIRKIFAATLFGASLLLGNAQAAGEPAPQPQPKRYAEATSAARDLLRSHLYEPGWLNDPRFQALDAAMQSLGAQPMTRDAFVAAFNQRWQQGPFSHVHLQVAQGSAEQMAAYVDQLRVGGSPARLTWHGDVALLTVDTMMGLDTIEQVDAAFVEIAARPARAMVLDLRANRGGAFVSRALISHLIERPVDIGVFASRVWRGEAGRDHDAVPASEAIEARVPWSGWTLSAFWRDVQREPLTRIQVQPAAPLFAGPLTVLISRDTASAAELTADALKLRDQTVLIGETSAGQMLSQAPFDLPDGLQLMLPVADYYSRRVGRIEGTGLQPDVRVPADQALCVALARFASGPVSEPPTTACP